MGPELAEHLGIAQVTYVAGIERKEDYLILKKEQEDCYEKIQVRMPVLLTAVKSLNEPRYPNVMKKMKANRMEVLTLTAKDLPELIPEKLGLKGSPTKVKKTFVPSVRKAGVMILGGDASGKVSELLDKLTEAKITL